MHTIAQGMAMDEAGLLFTISHELCKCSSHDVSYNMATDREEINKRRQ
jgi:hypothetical protein